VQCYGHGRVILHLGYGGDLYAGPSAWDKTILEHYGTTMTAGSCVVQASVLYRAIPGSGTTTTAPAGLPGPARGSRDELAGLLFQFKAAAGPRANSEALLSLARKLADHPAASAQFVNDLAWDIVDRQRQHVDAAMVLAKAVERKAPAIGPVLDTRGWTELRTGNNESASAYFEKAVPRQHPYARGVSLSGLAMARARLEQTEQAWDALSRAVQNRTPGRYLLEAYCEVTSAGQPGSPDKPRLVGKKLGPPPKPEIEIAPVPPQAGTTVTLRYHPWPTGYQNAHRVIVHWGVNGYQHPGAAAARAPGARQTYWEGTGVEAGVQQGMYREDDGWRVELIVPPTAHRIDFTLYLQYASGQWYARERDYSMALTPPANPRQATIPSQ
jgi:hypothetical protein